MPLFFYFLKIHSTKHKFYVKKENVRIAINTFRWLLIIFNNGQRK